MPAGPSPASAASAASAQHSPEVSRLRAALAVLQFSRAADARMAQLALEDVRAEADTLAVLLNEAQAAAVKSEERRKTQVIQLEEKVRALEMRLQLDTRQAGQRDARVQATVPQAHVHREHNQELYHARAARASPHTNAQAAEKNPRVIDGMFRVAYAMQARDEVHIMNLDGSPNSKENAVLDAQTAWPHRESAVWQSTAILGTHSPNAHGGNARNPYLLPPASLLVPCPLQQHSSNSIFKQEHSQRHGKYPEPIPQQTNCAASSVSMSRRYPAAVSTDFLAPASVHTSAPDLASARMNLDAAGAIAVRGIRQ
jgi:hypothetical protein